MLFDMLRADKSLHAKWIVKTHILLPDEYICSRCQEVSSKPYAVCPSCGAEMTMGKQDSNWVDEIEIMDELL